MISRQIDELRRDLGPLLADLPRERRFLLPALQRVQAELGSLPLWALETVGLHVRVPRSEVYGVATHSPELRLERPARRVVRVCTGLSCHVRGAPAILSALRDRLAQRDGDVPPDVALEEIHCAFACGVAPVVEVDGAKRGGLTPREAAALVDEMVSS